MPKQVRMKTTYAGPLGVARAGQVLELPDDDAAGLIEAGYAEAYTPPVAAAEPTEPAGDTPGVDDETTSTDGAPENTSRPKPKRKAAARKSADAEPAGDTPGVDDLLG